MDKLKDKPEKLEKLLRTKSWEVANLKALHYIIINIEQKNQDAVRNFKNAGRV